MKIVKKLDKIGFDLIELSDYTYEKMFKKFNKKIFDKSIKRRVKNAKVYLTGDFKTIKRIISSIEFCSTDGVGLGRPITTESNFAIKNT
ncbi:Aldolase-type TIM barrel domain-containing protein [Strongyloides ratti]|uniref:Aldolase-type TIM barrel domain-containing protein n=1 Tax=Strongyloides ratti TaxID=34506 RepID=A0A090LM84_STRRB|nr:Aldolase-type TIM barrel domain-containing protein [Strongyloides ratti]CEF70960.1 Aldolase-type TIM barrel domain-containing protein [Strongyloides ratti]